MPWPRYTAEIPLIFWGILLIIGFSLTQILVIYTVEQFFIYLLMWIIIVGIGTYIGYRLTPPSKQGFSLSSLLWTIFVTIGFSITILINIGTISINPFFIGAIWFLVIGISLVVTQGAIQKDGIGLLTGIVFILFSIPTYLFWEVSFIILAIGFGIPMILAGLYAKPSSYQTMHHG